MFGWAFKLVSRPPQGPTPTSSSHQHTSKLACNFYPQDLFKERERAPNGTLFSLEHPQSMLFDPLDICLPEGLPAQKSSHLQQYVASFH